MTKRLLIAFFLFFGFRVFAITHAECEEYKEILLNNLDGIDTHVSDISNVVYSTLDIIDSNSGTYTEYVDSNGVAHRTSTYLIPIYDRNGQNIGNIGSVVSSLEITISDIINISSRSSDMRALINSIQCSDSPSTNGCNCAEQLAQISVQVGNIYGIVVQINSRLRADLELIAQYLEELRDDFHDYSSSFDSYASSNTNLLKSLVGVFRSSFYTNDWLDDTMFGTWSTIYNTKYLRSNMTGFSSLHTKAYYPFADFDSLMSSTLSDVLRYGSFFNTALTISLNNFAYSNLVTYQTFEKRLRSIDTNTLQVVERFSIFNDFVFSSETPLTMYTDYYTDGSYRDYLTNYYIKVSKGQQSGSDNFTNWFSRIEILLASLVFQDEGTNFVDEAENTSQFENTLSQSVDTLSQAVAMPRNVTDKIDNMGQSFLGLLSEWRTIVSGNSLPSQFVLCDIHLPSQSRDSSLNSFRLETSLDSGSFRQLLDFCHAITTILFTMLFVWLSTLLLSFLLGTLAKLAKFCYMVYSALFGG